MSEARSEEMALARPTRRRFGWTAVLLIAVAPLWIGGFFWFAQQIPQTVADLECYTDAIVVLTGGSLRVQSGLSLLAAGKAKKLFISGVYHGTDVAALLRVSHQAPEHLACCIVLGHEADNTLGNALETAQWMHQEGFRSLRLVTASYHMPRSMLEFSRAMPEVRIIAHPVFPERDHADRWWTSPRAFAHVLAEYHKYLLALTGLRSMREGEGGG